MKRVWADEKLLPEHFPSRMAVGRSSFGGESSPYCFLFFFGGRPFSFMMASARRPPQSCQAKQL